MSTVASHKPQHAQQPQQRVVRKEPQVKPINRYAPPDYMILMYHPTPTLEDLGLTSYLDSPPSSPRARSPAREAKKADSLPAQDLRSASPARESPRRVLPAWDAPRSASPARESPRRVLPAWDAPRSASPARESITSVSAESKLTNSVAQEMRQTASTARQPMPAMTEAKERNSKRAPTPNEINQHLSKNVKPQSYVPSFAPKGWVPPADKYSQGHTCTSGVTHISKEGNQRSGSNLSNAVPNSMLTSQTEHTSLKTSDSAVGSSLAARPKKSACDWSMIAEQYSSESRQSDDMEAKRDTAYRRYINKGRPFGVEQMPDTGRHQNQMQDAWRHLNRSQTQPFSNQTFNQKNASGNIKDLFGGMSPYSCWIQSTPEDRRCS
ncbi:uncharacterized protein LOC133201072 [Saccostrea echinata]|uniref:uncharacterized protein LOC133201072 n=1 Tax=Saccostrea echinata TaxID=191078 RepID=UPI002A822884|nr:uncharacterized protein LOC133201072 [Saccostrea echinata]